MKINDLELLVTDKEDERSCSLMQFTLVLLSSENADVSLVDALKLSNCTVPVDQLVIPRKFLTEPLSYNDINEFSANKPTILHAFLVGFFVSFNSFLHKERGKKEFEERLDFLLQNGADINALNAEGKTPLCFLEETILSKKETPQPYDAYIGESIEKSAKCSLYDMTKILRSRGAVENLELLQAIEAKKAELKTLQQEVQKLKEQNRFFRTVQDKTSPEDKVVSSSVVKLSQK